MPSFIVHSIVGREILNRLRLTSIERDNFFLGNLLPDTDQTEKNPEWSSEELRIAIQKEKRITHFRSNFDDILEYPDLDLFLNKYSESIKKDIVTLAYFFHLYTDYYYFSTFLPKLVTFLDKDYKETNKKNEALYVKVNKTGEILEKKDFWHKTNPKGIYQEYSRLNKYLMTKYRFSFRYDELEYFLSNNLFHEVIDEVDPKNILKLLRQLDNFYHEALYNSLEEFLIFKTSDVDNLISNIIDSFLDRYGYLLDNYK